MIHKIRKGQSTSFRRVLEYNLDKPETEILTSNMEGETIDDLLAEFRAQQRLNPNAERSMFHGMIRLPPGENLTRYQWAYVADVYLEHLGYAECPFVAFFEHTGPGEEGHIHIVASMIRDNGTRVSDSFDYYRGQKKLRELEKEFGLRQVANSWEVGRKAPSLDEINAVERTGQPSVRHRLQEIVTEAAEGHPTLSDFLRRLARHGVDVEPRLTRAGRLTGVTYRLPDGGTMRGSDLGKNFAWPGLEERLGVSYDPGRDLPALLEAKDRYASGDELTAAKTFVKSVIDQATEDRPDLPELVRRLRERGIDVKPNLARTGHLSGLSFHYRDFTFKASHLGRGYTPRGLARKGVRYDPDEHVRELRGLERERLERERLGQADSPDPGAAGGSGGEGTDRPGAPQLTGSAELGGGASSPRDLSDAIRAATSGTPDDSLPALRDFYGVWDGPVLAELDWAHRAAQAGFDPEEIAGALNEVEAGADLTAEERVSYTARLAAYAAERHEIATFHDDPVVGDEPFLAERAYLIHARHHGRDEDEIVRDLVAGSTNELEREDLDRLLRAARDSELGGSEGTEWLSADLETQSFEVDADAFDPRLLEARDDLHRTARELSLAAERLRHEPTEEHLGAFASARETHQRAAEAIHRRLAGVDAPRDLQLHVASIEAHARRARERGALGAAHVRARRLDELARAYAAKPERSLYLRYLREERTYRRVEQWLRKREVDVEHRFAGGRGPAAIAAEARRELESTRAVELARHSEGAARHFTESLGRQDLETYERLRSQAGRLVESVESGARDGALSTDLRLRVAQARQHLDRAQHLAELGGPAQEKSRLDVSYAGQHRDLENGEVKLYEAARDLRERVHSLPAEPSRTEVRELQGLRRRYEELERELGAHPKARNAARVERLEEVQEIERRVVDPEQKLHPSDIFRLRTLERELSALDQDQPAQGWASELGPRAQALAAELEPRLVEIDVDRYARWMEQAAQREFKEPSQESLEHFYRARSVFRRAHKRHEALGLPAREEALHRAEKAKLLVAASPLRQAAERLENLAGTERAPAAEELHSVQRAFEKPLRAIVRQTEPEAANELRERLSQAYRQLGQARYRFERLPNEANYGELRSAQREVAQVYQDVAELRRQVLAEHLPELAGAHEAARAAEAHVALRRAEEISNELGDKLQGWRGDLSPQEEVPFDEIREPLKELDRIEVHHAETLGSELDNLRSRVKAADFQLAAERLDSLYEARDDDAPLNPDHLRAVASAEEHFVRAAAARPAEAEPWRRHFEGIIDRHLQRSTDQLVDRARPTGEHIALGPDPLRESIWRVAGDLVSYQRFHQALPELPDELEHRSLRPVISSLRYVQERIDRAIDRHEPVRLTPKLAEFLRDPRLAGAKAADQLWADRAALAGHGRETIREALLARGAPRHVRGIENAGQYVDQVAGRAVALAERIRQRLSRKMGLVRNLGMRMLPPELRLVAKGAGLLTPKATPLALASFLYTVAATARRQMQRAQQQDRQRER